MGNVVQMVFVFHPLQARNQVFNSNAVTLLRILIIVMSSSVIIVLTT
uniref:Uncharacterized protein n=1 Tax=Picea sitchensis TaxID=3332 RepID=A9NNM7_PICSI|nr:unknown [Picea sitchensis]